MGQVNDKIPGFSRRVGTLINVNEKQICKNLLSVSWANGASTNQKFHVTKYVRTTAITTAAAPVDFLPTNDPILQASFFNQCVNSYIVYIVDLIESFMYICIQLISENETQKTTLFDDMFNGSTLSQGIC